MSKKLLVLVIFLLAISQMAWFFGNQSACAFQWLFDARIDYPTGTNPRSVFCADLNGDGLSDLAVANAGSDNVSVILTNSADSSFGSTVNYGAGDGPYSVFCADLDGDNDQDLAVANYLSDSVSILKNNGDGTFASAVNYAVGFGPRSVFCTDLDGDGDMDLAVANADSDNVSVLKNNGDGTFGGRVSYWIGVHPVSVFCADVDGDSDLDLAVANDSTDNVSILKNYGNGTFDSLVSYPAGDGPVSVFCADLNGDGDPDLAVANHWSDNVSILINNGDGTFQNAINDGVADKPTSVFGADLNGDGDLDLAVVSEWGNPDRNNISILTNHGDGTFWHSFWCTAGWYSSSVFCADLDGSGSPDLAVANPASQSVSIFRNNGDLTFSNAVTYPIQGNIPAAWSIFCVDFDRRWGLDLIFTIIPQPFQNVGFCESWGGFLFSEPSFWDAGAAAVSVFCAELNGDGNLDLAVANYESGDISIIINAGTSNYPVGSGATCVFCADLDGDDDLDLAVAGDNGVSVLMNNGNGTFQSAVAYEVGHAHSSVFCADLNGDHFPDLAVANYYLSNSVSILMNNGDGTFQAAADYPVGERPLSVFCADLDRDNDQDLAVANSSSNDVSILKNNGDGTFQSAVNYGVGSEPTSVFCADLDGDSYPDLAVANSGSTNISIFKNNGDGTFQSAVNYGVRLGPRSVFCADIDKDGDLDIATAISQEDYGSILNNLSQIPANSPPRDFHLLFPSESDTTQVDTRFDWQTAYDPNLGDQIRYDLYISTMPGFEPQYTIIDSNLVVSSHTDTLEYGTYFWKVKAEDNWGAATWSSETYKFFHVGYIADSLVIVAYGPVDLIVTDPIGDSIGLGFNTIFGATYDTTQDLNGDGDNDDLIIIPQRLVGFYIIRVIAEPTWRSVYTLGAKIDGGAMTLLAENQPCPNPGEPDTFSYQAPWYKTGDVNSDWNVDVGDVVFLINYLFKGGSAPAPFMSGDANCDEIVDVGDVVYLINYLFRSGPAPSC